MSLRTRLLVVLVAVGVPWMGLVGWLRGSLDRRSEVDSLERFIVGRMVDGRAACEADPESFPRPPFRRRASREGDARPVRPVRPELRGLDGPDRRGPGPRDRRGPPGRGPADGPRGGENRRIGEDAGDTRETDGRSLPESPLDSAPIELFAYGPDFVSENPRAPRFPLALRQALEAGQERADDVLHGPRARIVRVAARMPWGEGPCAIVLASRPINAPIWLSRNQWISACALALGLAAAVFLAAGPIASRVRKLTAEVQRSADEGYQPEVAVSGRDEIAQLARAFNEAREKIRDQLAAVEDRERALRDFVANTAHDVMIPMTVLKGHLSALRDAGERAEAQTLSDAMEEAQYITSLLQNLSATAKLEGGSRSLERVPVDLGTLVARVVARHAPIARQKGIELNHAVPDAELSTLAELTLLEQAVSNLVHNAVRYGAEDGHVAVLLEASEPDGFRLRVIDDGPGIAPEEIRRLTERDFRGGEARTRYPEGQGLGLHIALEVARRHGFELRLEESEFGGLQASILGSVERA